MKKGNKNAMTILFQVIFLIVVITGLLLIPALGIKGTFLMVLKKIHTFSGILMVLIKITQSLFMRKP